VNRVMINVAN